MGEAFFYFLHYHKIQLPDSVILSLWDKTILPKWHHALYRGDPTLPVFRVPEASAVESRKEEKKKVIEEREDAHEVEEGEQEQAEGYEQQELPPYLSETFVGQW